MRTTLGQFEQPLQAEMAETRALQLHSDRAVLYLQVVEHLLDLNVLALVDRYVRLTALYISLVSYRRALSLAV